MAVIPDALPRAHARRLREIYRSAGWPVGDAIELDLLAAGLAERRTSASGFDTIALTQDGIRCLCEVLARNRRAFDAHESIVRRVVVHLQRGGRLAYTASTFRVKPGERWRLVKPDVFSLRRTFDAARCEPAVHEIKVTRADLLGDLRRHEKREGYAQVAERVSYVLADGIASPEEIPEPYGVWFALADGRLVEARPATGRPLVLAPMHWLQLLMHRGDGHDPEPAQWPLRAADTPPPDV